jgi:hypothetical protein
MLNNASGTDGLWGSNAEAVAIYDARIRRLMAKWKALAVADPDRVGRMKAGVASRSGWSGLFRRSPVYGWLQQMGNSAVR